MVSSYVHLKAGRGALDLDSISERLILVRNEDIATTKTTLVVEMTISLISLTTRAYPDTAQI